MTPVGIDVAKAQLDVWVWETETGESVPHNEAGIEARCARLGALAPDRIVVEATGGREVPRAAARQAAGLPVAVVNPRPARAFGRALGQLVQTDCLDARLLARMAAVLRPPVRPLPDADLRALRAVVVRRRQIAAMGAEEKTRRERAPSDLQPRIRAHLEWLQAERKALNRELHDRMQVHGAWRARAELLRSVPVFQCQDPETRHWHDHEGSIERRGEVHTALRLLDAVLPSLPSTDRARIEAVQRILSLQGEPERWRELLETPFAASGANQSEPRPNIQPANPCRTQPPRLPWNRKGVGSSTGT